MDINKLRSKLDARRGEWTRIADHAGISRKTIQRLMDDDDYNPTLATMNSIERAIREVPPRQREAA